MIVGEDRKLKSWLIRIYKSPIFHCSVCWSPIFFFIHLLQIKLNDNEGTHFRYLWTCSMKCWETQTDAYRDRQMLLQRQKQRHTPISYLISSEIWKLLWPLGLSQVRGTVCTLRANADCCFSKWMLYLSVVWQVGNRNTSPPLHCVLGSFFFPNLSIMCSDLPFWQSQNFHFGEGGS